MILQCEGTFFKFKTMKNLPEKFLALTHEGLHRITIAIEPIQSIDHLLAKFSQDKMFLCSQTADHPYGIQHEVIWTSDSPRYMAVLELTRGIMVLNTQYVTVTSEDETVAPWVSPCFTKTTGSFPLRCGFDFEVWTNAGLRMFLGLTNGKVQIWVFYAGQIYKPPFGNVFETSCDICLGHNNAAYAGIFQIPGQAHSTSFSKALQLLSDSIWNYDAFRAADAAPLKQLVRFNAGDPSLGMLPPTDPALIKKCSVAANKVLVDITAAIILNQKKTF